MIYRRPTSPVFWVPIPDTGQSRMELVEWNLTPGTRKKRITLTDPEKGDYTVEILDFEGAYSIEEIPDKHARQIINAEATGKVLGELLQKRIPEFKKCQKVLFYQVNPIFPING